MRRTRTVFVALAMLAACAVLAQTAPPEYPGKTWRKVAPESLGWSPDGLRAADEVAKTIRTDAYVIIHKGVVVHEYGSISRPSNIHSARKSIMSVLYGVHADRGEIKLDKTLAELGIDDKDGLTAIEKQATVRQLLQARSGIYHRSAYETREMAAGHPPRGAFKPGENFNYNNWDFNALGTIFKMATGVSVFDALQSDLAGPLQFEDFSPLTDTRWEYEQHLSKHPAYVIRLSARDLGRIGLLMARKGKWHGTRLLSEAWVRESTTSYSSDGAGRGYGYMWWAGTGNMHFGHKFTGPVYSARGNHGQYLVVDATRDLVIAHRVNAEKQPHGEVGSREFTQLLGRILAAGPNLVVSRP